MVLVLVLVNYNNPGSNLHFVSFCLFFKSAADSSDAVATLRQVQEEMSLCIWRSFDQRDSAAHDMSTYLWGVSKTPVCSDSFHNSCAASVISGLGRLSNLNYDHVKPGFIMNLSFNVFPVFRPSHLNISKNLSAWHSISSPK